MRRVIRIALAAAAALLLLTGLYALAVFGGDSTSGTGTGNRLTETVP